MNEKDKLNIELTKKLYEFDKLEEMATIGTFKDYTYRIYGNEGPIPHFHILKDNETIQCICIDKCEYFTHNNKYTYKLNNIKRKNLIDFLNKPHFSNKNNLTNWEFIVNQWNLENPQYKVDENIEMPNYLELK